MINVSNEFKQKIRESGKTLHGKASIALENGIVLNLGNETIMESGLAFANGTSSQGSFDIGATVIGQCTLYVKNFNDEFSQHDFTGAAIRPVVGLGLDSGIEWINKGTYTVDDAISMGGLIALTAYDNTRKLDTPFSTVPTTFPTTAFNLLYDTCLHCGVPLATSSILNGDFVINRRPDDEAITCREIVSWLAQISGNFAKCNTGGALELKWYDMGAFEQADNLDGGKFDSDTPYSSGDTADGGNFTDYNSGDNYDGGTFLQMERYHHIYALGSATINTDDVVITGIQVKAMGTEEDYGETYLYGLEGYVIRIDDNPLIQEGNAQTIAETIGAKIVGMRFRPMQITALSDPSREAGDVALVSDRKGNSYQVLLTNLSEKIGSMDTISCDAESAAKNSSTRYSTATKTIVQARNAVKQQISVYDIAVQQLTNLMVNSFGAFKSEEVLEDGSTIFYMHNKPTRAESQTIWKMTADAFAVSTDGGQTWNAGIDSQGNAVLNVLSAIGINAEWIKVVSNFSVGNNFNVNSQGILSATNAVLSGSVTANSGQIGPFTISDQGLKSAVIELFEDNNYPLIWLTKYGENGAILERANYEPSSFRLFSENDGEYVEMGMMARDDGQGTKGQLSMNKVYSNGVGAFKLTDEGFDFFKVENGDYTGVSLSGGALIMSKGDYSASISMGSDGSVYIGGAKIYIDASEVIINGHVF